MSFSSYEMLRVLFKTTNLTRDELRYTFGGPHPKTVQRILNDPSHSSDDAAAIMQILIAQDAWPWSETWQYPIARLYELKDMTATIERELGALHRMTHAALEACALTKTADTCGAYFFMGLYELKIASTRLGSYGARRVDAANASQSYFQHLIELLKDDDKAGAMLVKARAAANIVVTRWNATPPENRATTAMKTLVEDTGYLNWAHHQIELFPKIEAPAINALAVASRFKDRPRYQRLLNALITAESRLASSKAYNEDFDDFRAWLRDTGQNLPEAAVIKLDAERTSKFEAARRAKLDAERKAELKAARKVKRASLPVGLSVVLAIVGWTAVSLGVPNVDVLQAAHEIPHTLVAKSEMIPHTLVAKSEMIPHTFVAKSEMVPHTLVAATNKMVWYTVGA